MNKEIIRIEFAGIAKPIIENEKVKRMDKYIQHGDTSTLEHCVAVAYVSFYIAKKMHLRCDYNSLIRGYRYESDDWRTTYLFLWFGLWSLWINTFNMATLQL